MKSGFRQVINGMNVWSLQESNESSVGGIDHMTEPRGHIRGRGVLDQEHQREQVEDLSQKKFIVSGRWCHQEESDGRNK